MNHTILPGSAVVFDSGGVFVPGGGDAASNVHEYELDAGEETFTVDYTSLGLADAPTSIVAFGGVSKTAAGQSNLYGTLIEGTATATEADFELNAPCDVTGRKFYYLIVP
jgi:hypothetical protein